MAYNYRVRIINPKNKRDYMELTWHNMSDKFKTVNEIKLKMIDSFPNHVPSIPTFQVGYFERKGNQKRWLVQTDDIKVMYRSFREGEDIKLWCEKKENLKIGNEDDEQPKSKREKQEDTESEIRLQLEDKHGRNFSGPVYTLWAKFIRNGRH